MGPYREAAEDEEAGLDAAEIEAFRAAVALRTRRIRVGVVLTVLSMVASGLVIAAVLPSVWFPTPPTAASGGGSTRCETHLVASAGEPFRMTVCR